MNTKSEHIVDKHKLLESISGDADVTIEIGVGSNKRISSSIGIDLIDSECVDVVGDAIEVLGTLPSNSVAQIYSWHFIEHCEDVKSLLIESVRVLKPGGTITFIAPHFSNPFFYSDPTHKNFFGLYTFCYYASNRYFSRGIPGYCMIDKLILSRVSLVFKSVKPRYLRHGVKKAFQFLVNRSKWSQEFYEEMLVWLMPCYEVSYLLEKEQ